MMDDDSAKQVVYLDLADRKDDDRPFFIRDGRTDEEILSREELNAYWLDLIDR